MLHILRDRDKDQPPSASSEDDRLAALLADVSQRGEFRDEDAWFVAGVLVATQSARIRDGASLALADMKARDAGQSIVEVLRRPQLSKSAGTLLYALGELGLPLELETLIHIVENGSYEARAMSIRLVEDRLVEPASGPDFDAAVARLRDIAAEDDQSEKAEAAEAALAALALLSGVQAE